MYAQNKFTTVEWWCRSGFLRTIFFLLTIIFPVLCHADNESYKFVYRDVFACSENKFESLFSDLTTFQSLNTYIIHSSKVDENYVVFSHGHEYPSFRKQKTTQLYIQSGGTRWSEIEQVAKGIKKFTLYLLKENITHTQTLIFDENALSAVIKKSWEDESALLICWDYKWKNYSFFYSHY